MEAGYRRLDIPEKAQQRLLLWLLVLRKEDPKAAGRLRSCPRSSSWLEHDHQMCRRSKEMAMVIIVHHAERFRSKASLPCQSHTHSLSLCSAHAVSDCCLGS